MNNLISVFPEARTPEQARDATPRDEEGAFTTVAEFSSGSVVGVVQRFDWWNPSGELDPPTFSAGVDWDSYGAGSHSIEFYGDMPGSIEALPDLISVLRAIHRYMARPSIPDSTTVMLPAPRGWILGE